MTCHADVLVNASERNRLVTLANPDWAKEILPVPALAKQGVSFGLPRSITEADRDVIDIYLTQRRATGEIDQPFNKASMEANAAK